MDYFTQGHEYHERFRLPLVYSRACAIPRPDEGYYAIVCADRGVVAVEDGNGRSFLKAPVTFFVAPSHGIREISAPDGRAHSMIFRPRAVNANAPATLPVERSDNLGDYFFYRPFADTGPSGYSVKTLPGELVPTIDGLCGRLDECLNGSQGEFWPCMSRSYFLEILILLERNWYVADDAEAFANERGEDTVGRIREYLHASYGDRITLEGLAARFATNRTSLNRRFNEECGMSAMAYLNAVRIEVAASLLRNTELKISDIALRSGFADESYFSRAFKNKTGLSPALYRKSYPNPYG